jgi:signal transduction histidine kinase
MAHKILYVDDNPNNRLSIRQILEESGDYTFIEAPTGLEAIELAQAERPDLILMDINMPGMDGYETTTRLKSMPAFQDVPIVAVTGKIIPGNRERALAAGCAGYLTKPLKKEVLPQQIEHFLSGFRETLTVGEENIYLREYSQRLVERLEQKIQDFANATQTLVYTDAMKSRFIKLAAHELRTPLTGLRGYIALLTSPDSPIVVQADQPTLEVIEGITTSLDRLQGIIQDMVDMTRIEAGTLQLRESPISLSFILDKIKKEFQEVALERQQRLTIANVNHIPMMWADGERVTQILRNLVSNAIKYTPNGGTVEIAAEIVNERGLPCSPSSEQDKFVKIAVKDTGIGVAVDHQESIFQSFYEVRDIELHSTSKTDFMGSGAGLGLPIARGVAEAHGGSLWVESDGYDPEQCPGSSFYLILPLGTLPDS